MKPLHPKQVIGFASLEDIPYDPKAPIKWGARIKKIKGRSGDIYKIGDTGTTIGAFKNNGEWCYYVRWDIKATAVTAIAEYPTIVGIMGFKIEEIK